MKTIVVCFLACALFSSNAYAQEQPQPSQNHGDWTGSTEQKLWGLMTVWSEAKYGYPSFDARPDLDWDARVQEFIPRVIAATDIESYYLVLMEFARAIADGHTEVIPPWGRMNPANDMPPIEIQVVMDQFVIARVGDTDEISGQEVRPGLRIIDIDGTPVRTYFQENVLRYRSWGASHADDAITIWYLLRGPEGSTVSLGVEDEGGSRRHITLTRDSMNRDGSPFHYRIIHWLMIDPALETRKHSDDILYVRVSRFGDPDQADEFFSLIDTLDESVVRGMIIDVRYNLGGQSSVSEAMTGALIAEPVSSAIWRYPHATAARRAWGREPVWSESSNRIEPREGKRFLGPLVILTGPASSSTAEDFVLSLHAAQRAVIVGERTAGTSGNPLTVGLPGGGSFRFSTFKATYPDGREYVGLGILPDVEVSPTPEDIARGYDPVLQRGIAAIRELK
jgi:carboxyl-terminal processing protease